MSVCATIPIKSNSTRVKDKNFKLLKGKPLYQYIIDHCIQADCFDDIYVDTDSSDIKSYVIQNGFTPVFVDINYKNLALNEKLILEKINDKTRAILLTSPLFGISLLKLGLPSKIYIGILFFCIFYF